MTNLQLINQARSKFTEKMGVLKHWGFTNAKLAKKVGVCEKNNSTGCKRPIQRGIRQHSFIFAGVLRGRKEAPRNIR
jgi:hypothetical protein